jgi:outer membrane protein OmpA-like peptidoglycan-associated protein
MLRLTLTGLVASLAASLAALVASAGASAQEVRVYRQSDRVDPQEVARILNKTEAGAQRKIKFRSIRMLDGSETAEAVAEAAEPGALSLPVQFNFDSADLLPSAKPQLDSLAEGIKMLPPDQLVTIEGHTDATGSDTYNDQLSQRRAVAVKKYLVSRHGIDGARLKTVGMGEYVPLNLQDPYAPENRRVQFRGD